MLAKYAFFKILSGKEPNTIDFPTRIFYDINIATWTSLYKCMVMVEKRRI